MATRGRGGRDRRVVLRGLQDAEGSGPVLAEACHAQDDGHLSVQASFTPAVKDFCYLFPVQPASPQSHEGKFKNLFFVIFVASCENQDLYGAMPLFGENKVF
jgi:hypothetical protein